MVTVAVKRSAKLEPPLGIGVGREVVAEVTAASGDKIPAADLGLRTIHAIRGFVSQSTDVIQVGSVRAAGSLMNVIDIRNMCLATAGANATVAGNYVFYADVLGE